MEMSEILTSSRLHGRAPVPLCRALPCLSQSPSQQHLVFQQPPHAPVPAPLRRALTPRWQAEVAGVAEGECAGAHRRPGRKVRRLVMRPAGAGVVRRRARRRARRR